MTKKEILEATFIVFSEKGYGATLSEIADAVGIKKQSIYYHFKDKDELMYEIIESELQNFYASKSDEFDVYMQLGMKEALRSMFFSICDYYKDIKKLKFWRWILLIESKELFDRSRNLIRSNETKLYARVINLLRTELFDYGLNEKEIFDLVQTFVVMIHGVLDGILLYNDIYDPHLLIENSWNFYWHNIESRMR